MAMKPSTFDQIIAAIYDGQTLQDACAKAGLPSTSAFYAAIRRDLARARSYEQATAVRAEGILHGAIAAADAGDIQGAKAALARAKRLEPKTDHEAAALAHKKELAARAWARDEKAIAALDAKIDIQKQRARRRANLPKARTTIDDLQTTGDMIDAINLRNRLLLLPDRWMTLRQPPRHPAVEAIRCNRHQIEIHFRSGLVQTIALRWVNPTGDPAHDTPKFVCDCGRGCRKIYPVARGSYGCMWCVSAGKEPAYKSRRKPRDPKRTRVQPAVFAGERCTERDPVTKRLAQKKPKLPIPVTPAPARPDWFESPEQAAERGWSWS